MVVARISGGISLRNLCLYSCGVLLFGSAIAPARVAAQDVGPMRPPEQKAAPVAKPAPAEPKAKKLILKDGTFQVVREYQVNGDRVRYFSEERGAWEELPAALVDWDATAKDEATSQKAANALANKVHDQEEAKRLDNVSDIDASLQVGQGAFLPSTDGLFVVEGKTVRSLKQVEAGAKKDKLRTMEQVLSPIPIVPGKQRIYIAGEHSMLRLKTSTPEFYLREPPPDPDRVSRIETSSRPGISGPDVVLIRAKEIKNGRELESIQTLFGEKIGADMSEVAIQRWEVAPNVYRFTLGEALTPGEYVVAEVLPDGLNYFVWDFGVDGSGSTAKK